MKSKILITGGAGFIGSYLIKKLKNKNNIIIVDKKKNKKLINKLKKLGITYIQGNLERKKISKKYIRTLN